MSGKRIWVWPLAVLGVMIGAAAGVGLRLASSRHSGDGEPKLRTTTTTFDPSQYGTPAEIGRPGDAGNAGELYRGVFPSNIDAQERVVGGAPARFSGYTTWIRSVTRVPARSLVDTYSGDFLRVHATIFNRDTETQHVCACDFYVWSKREGEREADAVPARSIAPYTTMRTGVRLDGDVYLYIGNATGPLFIEYRPDDHVSLASNRSYGVWRVPGS